MIINGKVRMIVKLISDGNVNFEIATHRCLPAIVFYLILRYVSHTNQIRGFCGLLISALSYHAGVPGSIPSSLAWIFGRWLDWCHSD